RRRNWSPIRERCKDAVPCFLRLLRVDCQASRAAHEGGHSGTHARLLGLCLVVEERETQQAEAEVVGNRTGRFAGGALETHGRRVKWHVMKDAQNALRLEMRYQSLPALERRHQ